MVRFHWHVEGGHGAFIPAGGIAPDKGHVKLPLSQQVQHALVEIEVDRDRALVLLCYRLVHGHGMQIIFNFGYIAQCRYPEARPYERRPC